MSSKSKNNKLHEYEHELQQLEAVAPTKQDFDRAKELSEYNAARARFKSAYMDRQLSFAKASQKYINSLPSFSKHVSKVSVHFVEWSGFQIRMCYREEREHAHVVSVYEEFTLGGLAPRDVVPMAKALLAYAMTRGVDPDGALRALKAARDQTTQLPFSRTDVGDAKAASVHPRAQVAALRRSLVGKLVSQMGNDCTSGYTARTPIRVIDVHEDESTSLRRVMLVGPVLSDPETGRQPLVQIPAVDCVLIDAQQYADTGKIVPLLDDNGRMRAAVW